MSLRKVALSRFDSKPNLLLIIFKLIETIKMYTNEMFIFFRRLHELKFNFRKQNVTLSFLRWKMHVAMLENESLQSSTVSAVEFSGLAWLHKVAPSFPIQGSQVNKF